MVYLPRICNHCANPSCVASCPSGALYKREEDGIVLVDQDKCRGWRFCVSGCPYKKVYFNHLSGKAEKCIFCYPVTENGGPTVCSQTCVGRLRAIGVVLYDLDAVTAAAETASVTDLVAAQRELLLDPHEARVSAAAEKAGIPHEWLAAARRSPVYALAKELRVALPLHPEYRTLPMVWYVPPLSPVLDTLSAAGYDAHDPDEVFPKLGDLRVPLALPGQRAGRRRPSAGRGEPATSARHEDREAAPAAWPSGRGCRSPQRGRHEPRKVERLYRLLALAPHDERYVIPRARREQAAARPTQPGEGSVEERGRER